MSFPVIILGTGGHARVLADTLGELKVPIVGCVARESPRSNYAAMPFLGDDSVLTKYCPKSIRLVNGIGSVDIPTKRCEIFIRFINQGYQFFTIIHPTANVAKDVILGQGVQIMAGAIIQSGCLLEDNTIINTGVIVDHDCHIEAHAHLAPGTVLSGGVKIGHLSHIGTGSRVIQGVNIRPRVLVGAGSVVIDDLPNGSHVAGVPAKTIGTASARLGPIGNALDECKTNEVSLSNSSSIRKRLRIGYFGDGPWASRVLESLTVSNGFDVAFICPRFDRQDPELKIWSKRLGVPFLLIKNVNSAESLESLRGFDCDVFVSMSFDQIMKEDIIRLPPMGFINCHAGALPFYRGRNPINWALINSEKAFGVTVHYIDVGIDCGDIIVRKMVNIESEDNYSTLLDKAYTACSAVLMEALNQIAEGKVHRVSQSTEHPVGFYCGRRRHGDEWINWNLSSATIRDFVRALSAPGPLARTMGDVGLIGILSVELIPDAPIYVATVGEVVGKSDHGVIVKTGDTLLLIGKVVYIGADETKSEPFIPRWKIGTRLGIFELDEIYRLRSVQENLESRIDQLERLLDSDGSRKVVQ